MTPSPKLFSSHCIITWPHANNLYLPGDIHTADLAPFICLVYIIQTNIMTTCVIVILVQIFGFAWRITGQPLVREAAILSSNESWDTLIISSTPSQHILPASVQYVLQKLLGIGCAVFLRHPLKLRTVFILLIHIPTETVQKIYWRFHLPHIHLQGTPIYEQKELRSSGKCRRHNFANDVGWTDM